jgi:hypothetical protein
MITSQAPLGSLAKVSRASPITGFRSGSHFWM